MSAVAASSQAADGRSGGGGGASISLPLPRDELSESLFSLLLEPVEADGGELTGSVAGALCAGGISSLIASTSRRSTVFSGRCLLVASSTFAGGQWCSLLQRQTNLEETKKNLFFMRS